MRRARSVLAFTAALALIVAAPPIARAETIGTTVTVACSDGSSMTGVVTASALLALTQEVQTMLGCSLSQDPAATADRSRGTRTWAVFDYNPSDQALAPRISPDSMPATASCAGLSCTVSFPFKAGTYTALLVTSDNGLTGNLTGKSLTYDVTISGDTAGFLARSNGCGGVPANVRLYFTSARASGPSFPPPGPPINGLPPAGFYTQFWWSNPVTVPLLASPQGPSGPITVALQPEFWSDWDGQNGALPFTVDAFTTAVANVQTIGVSFGGGCFFENGVTTTADGVIFTTDFSESP
jgi:hypothetical protein